jgi:hypothetical protein
MKILLDENIDVRFKKYFPDVYEVFTVQEMGWNGIKNGTLLSLLGENNFDCWIVVDKNIPYQQNVSKFPCTLIVLDVLRNILVHLQPMLPALFNVLESGLTEKVIIIKEK